MSVKIVYKNEVSDINALFNGCHRDLIYREQSLKNAIDKITLAFVKNCLHKGIGSDEFKYIASEKLVALYNLNPTVVHYTPEGYSHTLNPNQKFNISFSRLSSKLNDEQLKSAFRNLKQLGSKCFSNSDLKDYKAFVSALKMRDQMVKKFIEQMPRAENKISEQRASQIAYDQKYRKPRCTSSFLRRLIDFFKSLFGFGPTVQKEAALPEQETLLDNADTPS